MTARARKRFLMAYAAAGPILLWSLYAMCRDRGLIPSEPTLSGAVLFVTVGSGAYCVFLGLPGNRLVRSGVTLLYFLCMTVLVLYVSLTIECSRRKR
jgi:hypothetical protein